MIDNIIYRISTVLYNFWGNGKDPSFCNFDSIKYGPYIVTQTSVFCHYIEWVAYVCSQYVEHNSSGQLFPIVYLIEFCIRSSRICCMPYNYTSSWLYAFIYMTYTVKLISFLKLIKPSKTVEVFRFKTEKKSNTVMCIKKK